MIVNQLHKDMSNELQSKLNRERKTLQQIDGIISSVCHELEMGLFEDSLDSLKSLYLRRRQTKENIALLTALVDTVASQKTKSAKRLRKYRLETENKKSSSLKNFLMMRLRKIDE